MAGACDKPDASFTQLSSANGWTYDVFLERTEEGDRRWTSDPVQVEVTEAAPGDVVLRI